MAETNNDPISIKQLEQGLSCKERHKAVVDVLFRNKSPQYFRWLLFIVGFGLLNLLFEFIYLCNDQGSFWGPLVTALQHSFDDGTFYLLSIVLIASTFGAFYDSQDNFNRVYGTARKFNIEVSCMFYSVIIAVISALSTLTVTSHTWRFYFVEAVFFVVTIYLSSRLYGVSILDKQNIDSIYAARIKTEAEQRFEDASDETETPEGDIL